MCLHTHLGLTFLPPCGDRDEVRVCKILKCRQIVLYFYECKMENVTKILQRISFMSV